MVRSAGRLVRLVKTWIGAQFDPVITRCCMSDHGPTATQCGQ